MKRRAFLAIPGLLLAGCSGILDQKNSLGDSATFGEIEVTVTDYMTSERVYINASEYTAPSNGIFALFHIEAHNKDVTDRDGPFVNPANYDTIEEEDGVIYTRGVNDIRVYGDGEGGHFPDLDREVQMTVEAEGYDLRVDQEDLEAYPAGSSRPTIGPEETISGWVIGVIKAEATPELRIHFNDTTGTWTTDN